RRDRLPGHHAHRGQRGPALGRHRAGQCARARERARRIPRRPRAARRHGRRRRRARARDGARGGLRAAAPSRPRELMEKRVHVAPPPAGLRGTIAVPGDKSIAHRALLFGALAEGETVVSGFPGGADTLSTLGAVRALGAAAEQKGDVVRIEGRGLALGRDLELQIDCGNSGTTMRLVAGLAAGVPGHVVLDGDASLARRPMERVAEPLRAMGATIETTAGHAPLAVRGAALTAIEWTLRVASAQVK